jgi:dihydroxy-acid dehydratase
MGYSNYDLEKPMIGIANSWNRATPGHYNLNTVSEYVKQGIFQAGGTPVEFGIIGPCDGMGVGNEGMHYCLPARDIIANEIEIMVQVNRLDAIVLLGSCDKIVPGLLMAAARLDIPAIVVVGGPSLGGMEFDGRAADNSSISEALGMLQKGIISVEEFNCLEDNSMQCCGSCSFLGTANTMGAITEALGMCLPGTSSIPAVMAERFRAAQESGRRIVEMAYENLTARKIITPKSLENAVRLGMAIGGSTNLALHIPAIAYEADCELSIETIDKLSRSTPHLAKIYPAGPLNVPDFYQAGGVPSVMKHLIPLLETDAMTCTGNTWGEILQHVPAIENEIIHSLDNPWHPWGSLGILKGNLAPDGAVTKPAAIHKDMQVFKGTAICFDSEEEATEAILSNRIKPGMVLVIRYEGPKGGPGMREMVRVMKMLYGQNLALSTAVVTDGRFSGTNNGCFVGHISPEASEGGPIAAVLDGDTICIDIPSGKITLDVSENEIARRLSCVKKPVKIIPRGYLNVYSRTAESADKGAIIRNR